MAKSGLPALIAPSFNSRIFILSSSSVQRTGDTTKTVIASTASPFKFNQSVLIALEDYNFVTGKDEFELLDMLEKKSGMKIPESLAELKNRTPIFDTVVEKDEMANTVSDFLKVE